MSTTQQEIATPKACNQRKRLIILISLALFFVDAAAVCIVLLRDNAVAVMLTVILLMIAEATVGIWFFRHNLFAVKIILNVLTNCFALTLIIRLIVTTTEANKANNIIYIATVAAMAILLICLDIVGNKQQSRRRTTRYLTYTATFVALSVLFKILGNTISSIVIIPNMRLSFVYVPWVLSAYVLGPVGGVITALIGDILGQLTVAVGGAINPLTTLSNALFPLAPALIFKFLKDKTPDWLNLLIGMVISLVVCTMGIGAYALFSYYNYGSSMSFWTYLLTIRSPQIIIIAINYFLCLLLLPTVKKMKLSDKLEQE
ncbi:MAG: folate family ECF transporter S component [Clostridiales bacterium]|nr:folate family ECF transporter S component [Clostridiales bacterium]